MKASNWPDRVIGEINQISDRAAMGLPDHYVAPLLAVEADVLEHVRSLDAATLVALVEDRDVGAARRIAAGWMLSAIGDPRLDPLRPEMIAIAGGQARIGTERARIDQVVERYARFGVKRSWIEKESPRFSTEIEDFALGKYPVTNGEFAVFLEDTEYPALPSSWAYGKPSAFALNAPVYTVSADAAQAYAAWLGDRTGRRFRLPTEYEWEHAAAGAAGRAFPWGDEFSAGCANTMEAGLLGVSPVGAFPAGNTPEGVADLAGNVEEYVSDVYHPYPGGELIADDLYRKLGEYRVARGGAFNRFADLARCQRRHGAYPSSLYAIGFRLAESLA
ncbi:formylglycine-generating enzyme family protein [Burkholderia alba]|uniref:formylglycine-generating enzyme family protein n=1 Tax=Burkholderia alba TaxID=2683677 RepID=UPI002B060B7E|nr:SUMF1/EgtB/PvdO family nonheme iron enzyme [Burkholderia alba]